MKYTVQTLKHRLVKDYMSIRFVSHFPLSAQHLDDSRLANASVSQAIELSEHNSIKLSLYTMIGHIKVCDISI